MSTIGKNIRKIRKFHKLNQTQFGELFDLKRSNIGSYEEERAEPKTDCIISIAKYFSIKIELLLTKELTVNDITHIDQNVHNRTIIENQQSELGKFSTLFIKAEQQKIYLNSLENQSHEKFEKLKLPIPQNFNSRAFQITKQNLLSANSYQLKTGDIAIGIHANKQFINKIPQSDCYIILSSKNIFVDTLEHVLRHINPSEVQEIWTVIGKYQTSISTKKGSSIQDLERRVQALEEKNSD